MHAGRCIVKLLTKAKVTERGLELKGSVLIILPIKALNIQCVFYNDPK